MDIKTIKQSNLLHGKMYHVATGGVEDAILGSSNFTVRGLGLGSAGNNIELNLIVDGNRDRQELKQWFTELWSSEDLVKDVKQDVLNYLKQLAPVQRREIDVAGVAGLAAEIGVGNHIVAESISNEGIEEAVRLVKPTFSSSPKHSTSSASPISPSLASKPNAVALF